MTETTNINTYLSPAKHIFSLTGEAVQLMTETTNIKLNTYLSPTKHTSSLTLTGEAV